MFNHQKSFAAIPVHHFFHEIVALIKIDIRYAVLLEFKSEDDDPDRLVLESGN